MEKEINLLIPMDFSDNAENALEYAIQFTKRFKVHIYLLYVYKLPVIATDVPIYGTLEEEVERTKEMIQENLKVASDYIYQADPEVPCSFFMEEGSAGPKILEAAKSYQIDLIIMGSKRGSVLGSMLFGNVTSKVLEAASCPVLVVPEKFSFRPIHQIVYASSFWDEDIAKINQLSLIAKAFDANIIVLNISEEDEAHRSLWLNKFSELVKETVTYSKISFFSINGEDIVKTLEKYLKGHPVDMLVMNTIHRMKFEKLYNPSLTERLSYHAELPLLVFHKDSV